MSARAPGWVLFGLVSGPAVGLVVWLCGAALIESAYTQGIFPLVARVVSSVSAVFPFALVEPLTVVAALALGWGSVRAWAGRTRTPRFGLLARLLALVSLVYAGFLAVWGANYHREPLSVTLGLPVRESSAAELTMLASELLALANATRVGQAEDSAGVFTVPGGVPEILLRCVGAYARAGDVVPFPNLALSPPKPLLISPVLSWLGLLGFYSPPTAEPTINAEAPLVSLPFTALHEMAHARGVASEDEASYIAYRVARAAGDPVLAYSSSWSALRSVVSALGAVDREAAAKLIAGIDPGVRRDSDAWRVWMTAHESPLRGFAGGVNNAYLRSQGVPDGVRSYGRVVDLLLADMRSRQSPPASPPAP